MKETLELQQVKEFVKLSILINTDRKFMPPLYDRNNKHQKLLYKAISELKKDGTIKVESSGAGEMIITLNQFKS